MIIQIQAIIQRKRRKQRSFNSKLLIADKIMISIIPTYNTKFRTFGWVQDPSNLRSLCDVVAVFDKNSNKHKELINNIIPKLVEQRDGRDDFVKY